MEYIKCVIVGDGSVGKTSMLISYSTNCFSEEYIPTVFDNYSVNLLKNDRVYTLGLWDTAGQCDYDRLRPLSYNQTDVFLICYSVADKCSFENIQQKWTLEIKHHCPNVPYLLIATKIDLRDDRILLCDSNSESDFVSHEDGLIMKNNINAIKFVECSSKNQLNIRHIFDIVVDIYIEQKNKNTRRRKKRCKLF